MCSLTCIKLNWWLKLLCLLQCNGILFLPHAGEITVYPTYLFCWSNFFVLVRDLGALEMHLVLCLRPARQPSTLWPNTLYFLGVWLDVEAAPLTAQNFAHLCRWIASGTRSTSNTCSSVTLPAFLSCNCFTMQGVLLKINSQFLNHFLIISRKLELLPTVCK